MTADVTGPVDRPAARLICVDRAGAVLLQSVVDPAEPEVLRWVTPGGGIDPGEDAHDAACREAWEELGLTLTDLGEPVGHRVEEFGFAGVVYRGHGAYFAVRTERFDPAPRGMDAEELAFTRGAHWLVPDELEALAARGAVVAPIGLAAWVRELHATLPAEPLRPTVRVLVVDRDDRVLLLRMQTAEHGFWFPPGGGVEPGESMAQAAVRELGEELGLDVAEEDLGPCVWTRRHVLGPDAGAVDLRERWHLLRVDSLTPDRSGWTELELATIRDVRWWTLAEIAAEAHRPDGDAFTPRDLVTLLPDVLDAERAGRLASLGPRSVGI